VCIKKSEFGPLANATDYVSKAWPTSRNPTNPDKKRLQRLWRGDRRETRYIHTHPLIAKGLLLHPISPTSSNLVVSNFFQVAEIGHVKDQKVHVASWSVSLDTLPHYMARPILHTNNPTPADLGRIIATCSPTCCLDSLLTSNSGSSPSPPPQRRRQHLSPLVFFQTCITNLPVIARRCAI
jgi:hypothetical protein